MQESADEHPPSNNDEDVRSRESRSRALSRKRQRAKTRPAAAEAPTAAARTAGALQPVRVTVPGAQREAARRKLTRAQVQSEAWRNQGKTALTEQEDWQTPHALFPGVNIASSKSDRACLTPLEDRATDANQGDAWVNDQMMEVYAHLVQRARMEEGHAASGRAIHILAPAATKQLAIIERLQEKLDGLSGADMERAEQRVTACKITVSVAERSEQEATERARDATDTDTFVAQEGTAEAEKAAWEQVRKAKQRTRQSIQADAEATKLLTRRQDKVKQLQVKLEGRLQTARRAGEAAAKRKPNRVFLLIGESAHWWLVEIDRATRTIYQHDGFNSSDTDVVQRVLSWWTETCEHDLPKNVSRIRRRGHLQHD